MHDSDPAAAMRATMASFDSSLVPMLIADDERRYVQANRAACLFLRCSREAVLRLSVDDLTTPEFEREMQVRWDALMRDGIQSGTVELLMPDGPRLHVDYSATANVVPGQHLTILGVPATEHDLSTGQAGQQRLSEREREVLALVAMGENGTMIAHALGISPSTVESHVRHCLTKLEAKNRAHAIALGLQRGEIGLSFAAPPG